MSKLFWFGTRGHMQWVPMMAPGPETPKVGWSNETQQLGGGLTSRRSVASHREYNFEWPPGTRAALRPIMDYADGIHGPGPIYFVMPDALDTNALPAHWAFPAQTGYDAPLLYGDSRPHLVPTVANTLGYPAESIYYDLVGTSQKVYVPIPPGYVAWIGVHGSSDGWGGVRVTPFVNETVADAIVYPEFLSVTDTTRVNTSFSSVDYEGIELSLGHGEDTLPLYPALDLYPGLDLYPTTDTPPADAVVLSGLIVQILKIGVTPAIGGFISGQGHSGCTFIGRPNQTPYMIGDNRESVGMTARLAETEAWK